MSDTEIIDVAVQMLNGNPPPVVGWFELFKETE
jgi:hypothetical protein